MPESPAAVENRDYQLDDHVRESFRDLDARAATSLHADVEDEQALTAALDSFKRSDKSTLHFTGDGLTGEALGKLEAAHFDQSAGKLNDFQGKLAHLDPVRFPLPKLHWPSKIPKPVDQTFWWAETSLIEEPAGAFSAAFRDKGLPSFIGGPYARDNAIWTQFGATARFGLSADRRPKNGQYLSVPHVVINGGMSVSTFEGHWYAKDSIAFGGLTLSQTVFQFGLAGPSGDSRVIKAHSELADPNWTFNYKNIGGSRKFSMPGFRTFPPAKIDFGALAPADDLWVELTVRVDIRVRYGGWAQVTPLSTIEFSQWKANPL
ncbi:hypothetical protein EV379_1991 [Microterricola gilva]|uniref:Uncharacterized protein n=1 Tax=Microterricola gilva TaxID=393267 RepID=A0A4Q8AM59_9MICO|nr:hypothetical protein [Microterricola gilva]RZU65657.1 hypothetical protein EV379_1991 [Microterricola gilva]